MAGFSTHLQNSFTALKHRNYRLFLAGECVSLIGTWMQSIALSWPLVAKAMWISLVNGCGNTCKPPPINSSPFYRKCSACG